MQNNTPGHFNASEHVQTRSGQEPCRSYTLVAGAVHAASGTVLAASSHRAAPYTHRVAQPLRLYAALSAACMALHCACPLRVRRRANRATPCNKIKIVLFFLNAVQTFPVSVWCCSQCARRMYGGHRARAVHKTP